MEKQKNTTQNNVEQDKAQQLFNAILEQPHLHTSKSVKEKPKKETNTFHIFTPFKYLWRAYSALSFSIGFVILTLTILGIFVALMAPSHHRHNAKHYSSAVSNSSGHNLNQENPSIAPIAKSPFLSHSETTYTLIELLSKQKSKNTIDLIEKLNNFVNITPNKTLIGLYGQPLDFHYVGNDTLKFSLKTQYGNSTVQNNTYQIFLNTKNPTIIEEGGDLTYSRLVDFISSKLSFEQKTEFLKTNTFTINNQKFKVDFEPGNGNNQRGAVITQITS